MSLAEASSGRVVKPKRNIMLRPPLKEQLNESFALLVSLIGE